MLRSVVFEEAGIKISVYPELILYVRIRIVSVTKNTNTRNVQNLIMPEMLRCPNYSWNPVK